VTGPRAGRSRRERGVVLALVLVLDTWVLWRAVQHGKGWYWVAFGVLSGAAMYVQQLAAMYLLALGMLPLLTRKPAVIVRTGEKRLPSFTARTGAFPVTIITVMVSPMARPTPSITAVKTPERAAGKVTRQIVCQGVAPRAQAPSR